MLGLSPTEGDAVGSAESLCGGRTWPTSRRTTARRAVRTDAKLVRDAAGFGGTVTATPYGDLARDGGHDPLSVW